MTALVPPVPASPEEPTTEHQITLSAVVDMSYSDSPERSPDEPYGYVQLRVHVGDQDFRGPSLDVNLPPNVSAEREPEMVARAVAQWFLNLVEKGHSHYVR